MSTIANPLSSTLPATTASAQSSAAATSAATDPLASESTFLTLLVSQMQNQDPLDPVDSNQFVSQLTEYSQLEQLLGIHTDTTAISQAVTADSTQTATATGTTNQTTSTTGAAN